MVSNIPPIIYEKWPYFFIFSIIDLSMAIWPFLVFMAFTRLKIEKIEKIRPLSLLNLKKFL